MYLNFENGLGVNVIKGEKLTAGIVIGYDFGRDQDDGDRLDGLGDIDGGVDGRIFVSYDFDGFKIGATLRRDLSGSDDGLTLRLDGSTMYRFNRRLRIRLAANLTFADDDYMQT